MVAPSCRDSLSSVYWFDKIFYNVLDFIMFIEPIGNGCLSCEKS
jgi:hypothetical protein